MNLPYIKRKLNILLEKTLKSKIQYKKCGENFVLGKKLLDRKYNIKNFEKILYRKKITEGNIKNLEKKFYSEKNTEFKMKFGENFVLEKKFST